MHEVSLGGTIRDYLTGEELEETTYEEIRQGLAKLLVEELGYPKDRLEAKVGLDYEIDGQTHSRTIDLLVRGEDGRALMLVLFCSGSVGSFERETGIGARIFQEGPIPLAVVTDTMEATLMNTSGEVLATSMKAIPKYADLPALAAQHQPGTLEEADRDKLTRIFHAYCGFLVNACCGEECMGPVKG